MECQLSAVLSAVGCPCDWTLGEVGHRSFESHRCRVRTKCSNTTISQRSLADHAHDRIAER